MNDECEEIFAELTESQKNFLIRYVETNMRPVDATEEDGLALLELGLFKREVIDPAPESYSAFRESRTTYGPPIPSEFGRECVKWYQTHRV